MREPFVVQRLSGWGRSSWESSHVYRPEQRAALARLLASGQEPHYIPRGLGRSYGDASLNRDGGVLSFLRLNRFLAFDPETGILECEAGVSLGEILDVFLPRGFFPPVTPGTRHVTVGGAIAADVHGKNHHRDGAFARFVLDMRLLTPAGEVLTCSPETEREVFWATAGGMGLTGLILSARLRLRKVETAYVRVDYVRTRSLDETLAALAANDERYPYSVAWLDGLAGGRSLGRGVLMRGHHATRQELPSRIRDPLALPGRACFAVPFDFPACALNRLSVGAFNTLYYLRHGAAAGVLVDCERFFYPLDGVRDWNRLYGRRGFVQYQFVLPPETSAVGLSEVLTRCAAAGRPPFLAVLKGFGEADPGPLSFPCRGYTLALDLPAAKGLPGLLEELDGSVLRHRGRLYLAKDSALDADTFAAMYPQAGEFRAVKARLDPKQVLSSNLARRIGLARGAAP